ncbi:unnamed protein product, partial [Aphanomyces euteiches]
AQANNPPPANPDAAASSSQESSSSGNSNSESSSDSPSFDERRRRATERRSSAHPSANIWQHYADQRRQAAKVAKEDVGYHRPTMKQLAPVLALADDPATTGRELFEAFENAVPTSTRPIVAYMHMDVGFFINQIDEGHALRAVLHDHRNEGIDEGLADLVQLTANTNSRQLIWGLASLSAIPILENKPFKIPVKDGTQTFTMQATSAMDGFFLDNLGFDAHREAKSHLWDVLRAAGVTPLTGLYTNTSEAFGTTGSRYRLTFKVADPPPMFKSNGRLIDDIILLGKCYRVYGKDWYNHRKQTQRLDLDILAREKKIPIPGSKPAQTSNNTRQTQDGKRQRLEPEPDLPWELRVVQGFAGGGKPVSAKFKGNLVIKTVNGMRTIEDVYYFPQSSVSLFSLTTFNQRGFEFGTRGGSKLVVSKNSVDVLTFTRNGRLYELEGRFIPPERVCTLQEIDVWHRRLGHVSTDKLHKLAKNVAVPE